MKNRIPITLTPQDRARLEVVAAAQDVSLSEAVRRAVLAEYERIQDQEVRQRIESPLQGQVEQLLQKMLALEPHIGATSVRMLALINCMKSRPEIEAEIRRLVQQ